MIPTPKSSSTRLQLPCGLSGSEPASAPVGAIAFATDTDLVRVKTSGGWADISTGGGGGTITSITGGTGIIVTNPGGPVVTIAIDPATVVTVGSTAGGDLSGTYPDPNVIAIHETSGPTKLTIGSIAANQLLVRTGTTVVGTTSISDTQHGTRAGGALHANANSTTAGFLPATPTAVLTWLAAPSSANLALAVTDETGSGSLVFSNSPTLVTPALGTPSSGVLTNCTGRVNANQTADQIATSGSPVVISSTAPTANQVLTASSSTAASWQTPTGGGGSITSITAGTGIIVTAPTGPVVTVEVDYSNILTRASNDWAGFPSVVPVAANNVLLETPSKAKTTVADIANYVLSTVAGTGNPYIDPPLTANAANDEFESGSVDLAVRGWTVFNAAFAAMTRVGDIDPYATTLTATQYRSRLVGSQILIQIAAAAAGMYIIKTITTTGALVWARAGAPLSNTQLTAINKTLSCGFGAAGASGSIDTNNTAFASLTTTTTGAIFQTTRVTAAVSSSTSLADANVHLPDIIGVRASATSTYQGVFANSGAGSNTTIPVTGGPTVSTMARIWVLFSCANTAAVASDSQIFSLDFVRLIEGTSNVWIANTPRLSSGGGGGSVANLDPHTNGFRLAPNATDAFQADGSFSTVFMAPVAGDRIALYDGADWVMRTSTGASFALTTHTAGVPFDVYARWSGSTIILDFAEWQTTVVRGVAADIVQLNGVWVKASDATKRYLGTVLADTTNTYVIRRSGNISVGNRGIFGYWNVDNQRQTTCTLLGVSALYTYTSTTVQRANNSGNASIENVQGLAGLPVQAQLVVYYNNTGGTVTTAASGISLNSITAFDPNCLRQLASIPAGGTVGTYASLNAAAPLGRTSYFWLESGGTNVQFYGRTTDSRVIPGMSVVLWY